MEDLQEFRTIAQDGEAEQIIKGSRFITALKRVYSEEEAQDFIAEKKKEHDKATHNCSAYMIGANFEIQRASDDGEPQGTAGVPMLEVFKQTEVTNTVAVVTRYFGGTKLGTGGLIRAYSHGVSNALKELGVFDFKLQTVFDIEINYSLLGSIDHFLESSPYTSLDRQFTDKVTLTLAVNAGDEEQARQDMQELSSGQAIVTELEQRLVGIPNPEFTK